MKVPLGSLWGPLGRKWGAKDKTFCPMGSQEGPWSGFGTYFSWIGTIFRCILWLIFVFLFYSWACCKIVVRVLHECLIQGLLQDCPPARAHASRSLLQDCCMVAARLATGLAAKLLQEYCKSAWFKACCKLAARLPDRPPAALLQDDCCKIVARLLQECCKACHKIAARVLQGCCKTWCKTYWAASGIFL